MLKAANDQREAAHQLQLGNRAYDLRDFATASRHYGAAAQLQPQDVASWINLGLSLLHANDPVQARTALQNAVELAPTQLKPLALLAAALQRSEAMDAEQIPILERVLALSPNAVDMRLQLASSQFGVGDYGSAQANLQRVLELAPDNLVARWQSLQMPDAIVAPDQAARDEYLCRWRRGIDGFEAINWRDSQLAAQAGDTLVCATNFYLAYLGLPLVQEQRLNGAVLRTLAHAAYPALADVPVHPIGKRRRRLAIFSASLNAHSVSRVWSPALLALPAADFELAAFYPDAADDASTANWRARVERFESGKRSVETWITALRTYAPDIVLFPDIGMNRIVQAVAALRHAPVQIAAWGHPVTSGLDTIDYFLSADACEPDNAAEHYSEQLVRLPRLGTCLDLPAAVQPAQRDDDASQRFSYVCVQSADKLHPGHDALFARVLNANPHARLDILCNAQAASTADALATRLQAEFSRRGVAFEQRCQVHAKLPVADYYHYLERADACLDSLDFSGGITSLDALWRDLPIVTLPGALMRGRQTYGMLKLLGLDELIAADLDDYVGVATRLAQDMPWRESLVARIHALKTGLYRDDGVVHALADFLRNVEPPAAA
jgi:predicted O-linked N-acetylglucosamine transferase (SPINDLY family)